MAADMVSDGGLGEGTAGGLQVDAWSLGKKWDFFINWIQEELIKLTVSQ